MDVVQVLAIVGSATVMLMVLELIRRGRLKERYALLWLFATLVLLILSFSKGGGLDYLSHKVGIFYPPSFLFLVAFIFLLLITLHFSAVLSGLSDRNKRLAQELAILRQKMTELEQSLKNAGSA